MQLQLSLISIYYQFKTLEEFADSLLDSDIDLIGFALRSDINDLILVAELLENRLSLAFEGFEPLLDGLLIIIGSSTALSAFQKAGEHSFLGAGDIEHAGDGDIVLNSGVPGVDVLLTAGEPVEQEFAGVAVLFEGGFDQSDEHLGGDEAAFLEDSFDFIGVRALVLHLVTKQVASGQMHEAEIGN